MHRLFGRINARAVFLSFLFICLFSRLLVFPFFLVLLFQRTQACEPCPAGTYSFYGSVGIQRCMRCPYGTYSAEAAAVCTLCGKNMSKSLSPSLCFSLLLSLFLSSFLSCSYASHFRGLRKSGREKKNEKKEPRGTRVRSLMLSREAQGR